MKKLRKFLGLILIGAAFVILAALGLVFLVKSRDTVYNSFDGNLCQSNCDVVISSLDKAEFLHLETAPKNHPLGIVRNYNFEGEDNDLTVKNDGTFTISCVSEIETPSCQASIKKLRNFVSEFDQP